MIYPDFLELLRVFEKHRVAYVVIGGYAVGIHSEPRYTKDLDLLIAPIKKNAKAVLAALTEFGAPVSNLSIEELAKPGLLYVFGIAPLRVDILNRIKGVDIVPLIKRAHKIRIEDTIVRVANIKDLIKLKKISGRKQDLADIEKLRAALKRSLKK